MLVTRWNNGSCSSGSTRAPDVNTVRFLEKAESAPCVVLRTAAGAAKWNITKDFDNCFRAAYQA